MVFIAAIVYLTAGIPLAGTLGIIFAVASMFFGRMGYIADEKKMKSLYGSIPMFIGLVMMVASGALLNFDLAVIIGGFLLAIGGVLISTGK